MVYLSYRRVKLKRMLAFPRELILAPHVQVSAHVSSSCVFTIRTQSCSLRTHGILGLRISVHSLREKRNRVPQAQVSLLALFFDVASFVHVPNMLQAGNEKGSLSVAAKGSYLFSTSMVQYSSVTFSCLTSVVPFSCVLIGLVMSSHI